MLLTHRAAGWRRKSTWRAAVWIVLALVVAGGIAFWIATRPTTAPRGGRSAATGPMPVVAATAEPGSIDITVNALGTVTPLATVTVKAQIAGRLMRIAFTEGQMVHRGDLLAQIDSRPFEFTLAQMQGQLARDQALLRTAELDLNRFQTLLKQDSIARQQVDTQESLVRQLRGTVQSDQAMVDNAKLNIEYTQIVSPLDGRVGLRQVDEGNYVQLNDPTGIVVITQLQPITVLFAVPEDQLPVIMSRLRGGATLAVTAWDRARKNKLAEGTLVAADNVIDTTTGTVRLRARFDNQNGELYPNQFVNVQLLVDTLQNAIVIPTAAVQRGAPGTFVYAIKPDETVTARPVQLGPAQGERTSVQSGLQPGEKVVVDGADKLREGAKVSVRDATGAAAAGAAPADPQAQRRRRNTQ